MTNNERNAKAEPSPGPPNDRADDDAAPTTWNGPLSPAHSPSGGEREMAAVSRLGPKRPEMKGAPTKVATKISRRISTRVSKLNVMPHRRIGTVAHLPKAVRDRINVMLSDGLTYKAIIQRL